LAAGSTPAPEDFDVLIVGAGLSGIGAARHLQDKCPGKSFAILEMRDAIGGTWDLFRYPGIRSDSDMYTLGYAFKPWRSAKAIADGPAILDYIKETAEEAGIDRHIRFGHRVVRASWSSEDARWTVEAETAAGLRVFRSRFVMMCSGYYRYDVAHRPAFPGEESFAGRILHPQFWPEDLDYSGKRVVVIGSGATAVTLVPEMAKTAAHVTMLQRSPSYVVSRPSRDGIAEAVKRALPERLAYRLVRFKNVLMTMLFYKLSRARPKRIGNKLIGLVRDELGPDFDVETHFTPRYDPWDQRLCLVPDGDLFEALRTERASVVTAEIDTFTPTGIRLRSGEELPADLVVAATGLQVNLMGDAEIVVDGAKQDLSQSFTYKALMFSGVPNLIFTFGYTNASWTLKADLTADWACRLIEHMDSHGYAAATPVAEPGLEELPFVDFTSGYIQRALAIMPKQGARKPWRLNQNYALDMAALRLGRIEDGTLRFTRACADRRERAASEAQAGGA
jgi:cation diffusion facilitator CzcD-associated flavoprotein CzcO